MIERYSTSEMQRIWSDVAKFDYWLLIEKLVAEEWAKLGVIPLHDAEQISLNASFTLDQIKQYEQITKHDFAAFVDVISETVGESGRWIHYGLTSSDVIDTALSLQMRDALIQIADRLNQLLNTVWTMKQQHYSTLMVGRTHGMHAEPITLGHKMHLWALELQRHQIRLVNVKKMISVGAISGTVGTYSTVDPRVEQGVCATLHLKPEASRQIINRDRHAEFIWVVASIATTLDAIATEIRLLSRTEVGEVAEGFAIGQKGSSAMPHKNNPVRCERISGLSRILRGYVITALENNVLWHERDISHSSAERLMIPDASSLIDFMLKEMIDILENLTIYPEKMKENLDSGNGIIFSHRIMLSLIQKGMTRQDAYKLVQKLAQNAFNNNESFKELIYNNSEIADWLNIDEINGCFVADVHITPLSYDILFDEEVN